ncbi:MAG TPA: MarR family transcriptional regulator [Burkholderiaceae bacterium]|nr:MarR family transcriptional regulator [Burkholderiaceae bacterium]
MAENRPPRKRAAASFYSAADYVVEDAVGFLLSQARDSMRRTIERRMARHGLTHAQWAPLIRIARGGSTAAELAQALAIDGGAMVRMLDRLEAKRLIRRERSQQDRRVIRLALTPEGQRVVREVPAVLAEVNNEHLAGFSAAELDVLKRLLRRVIDNGRALNADG